MRDIMKLALRLFLFALVASVALALTNEVTKGPIAEQKIAAQREALNKVLPGYEYAEIEAIEGLAEGSLVDQLFTATDASGNVAGYAMVTNPQGYGGPIPVTVGISTEGYVTQTYVGALSETAGLGTKVAEAPFMEQFIGIPADPDTLSDNVDTIGGATVSSSAFISGVKSILDHSKNVLGIVPNAGDKDAILAAAAAASGEPAEPVITTNTYDVMGFGPMKVEVAVDDAGKIASVTVLEHNETPGFGADLISAGFDALVGQDVATAQIDVKAGVTMTSNGINEALTLAGTPTGPAIYDVTGFGPMKVAIEVDDAGKIVSVAVTEHGETPGFGADLIDAGFDALVGQDIATAQIDVKAGVTMTSKGINDALKQAAAAVGGETVIPGDPYTVKGFQKLTLYVEVADGKIVSVSAPAHNETPGFGADMLTEEALASLVGLDLATGKVDVKAGVTMTSNAINDAIKAAAAANGIAVVEEKKEEAAPAEEAAAAPSDVPVYEVTGFYPMKVAIEVDEAGKIASFEVVEHTETPGFGADVIAAGFDALIGQDAATAKIDVKAGATFTCNALNDALKAAAPAAEKALAADAAAATYEVLGFQAMKVEIAVDEAGKIVSVKVVEHNETPGFGADVIAKGFDALVGQDIATAKFDTVSGSTFTCNGINDALKAAAAAAPVAEEAPAAEAAAATYEVLGFQAMKVEIAVDEAGKIVSVKVVEHNETPGFGADVIAKGFDALVGQDIATAKFDTVSGSTFTCNGINDALKAAAPAVEAAPAEAVTYDVTGFQAMKVAIAVGADSKIVSVEVLEHNETPGFGADVIAKGFDALVGQDIATAKFDVVSGSTFTCNGINDALKAAAQAN